MSKSSSFIELLLVLAFTPLLIIPTMWAIMTMIDGFNHVAGNTWMSKAVISLSAATAMIAVAGWFRGMSAGHHLVGAGIVAVAMLGMGSVNQLTAVALPDRAANPLDVVISTFPAGLVIMAAMLLARVIVNYRDHWEARRKDSIT